MGSLKALFLAGAVALAATGLARAADLPPPPLEPAPPPVAEFSGWYLRGDVGIGSSLLTKFTPVVPACSFPGTNCRVDEKFLDDSALADIGFGYQFNNWLRFDVTGEYRTSQRFQAIESCCTPVGIDTYSGSIQSSTLLANGYFDIGTWYGITPYVGAGVGVARTRVASLTDVGAGAFVGGVGFAPSHSVASLAWAAMVGLAYDITPNVKLDVSYRYLDLGHAQSAPISCVGSASGCEVQKYHLASNDFRIGLRWMFNAPPPPPAYEAPIVRKY